jgi:hypothetical protein
MATFEQYNRWQTTGLSDLASPLALGGERNRGYLVVKLVARSGEDHDTQGTAAVQTIDIRAAEAAHSWNTVAASILTSVPLRYPS